jgi:hypothetical protein
VTTDGYDYNGGGFNPARAGAVKTATDNYTYGPSKQVINFTDLQSHGLPYRLHSNSRDFVAADIGHILYINASSGAAWRSGYYEITSVSGTGVGNYAEVAYDEVEEEDDYWPVISYTDPASGGVGVIGGSFASPSLACAASATGNRIYIKSGDYLIINRYGVYSSSFSTGNKVIGYGSTRDDRSSRPVLKARTAAEGGALTNVSMCNVSNISGVCIDGRGNTTITGFTVSSGGVAINCHAVNCTKSGFTTQPSATNPAYFISCTATGCSVQAAFSMTFGVAYGCEAYDNSVTGFSLNLSVATSCISESNSGASSFGFDLAGRSAVYNCSSYLNGGGGYKLSTAASQTINCCSQSDSGYGFAVGAASLAIVLNCAAYNTASGAIQSANLDPNYVTGFITVTDGPFFTDAANGDFSLNSTPLRGALLRSAGFPATIGRELTSSFVDIGAAQAEAAAGGGGTRAWAFAG